MGQKISSSKSDKKAELQPCVHLIQLNHIPQIRTYKISSASSPKTPRLSKTMLGKIRGVLPEELKLPPGTDVVCKESTLHGKRLQPKCVGECVFMEVLAYARLPKEGHPNVLRYYGFSMERHKIRDEYKVMLYIERAQCDLLSWHHQRRHQLLATKWSLVQKAMREITNGLMYLHSQGLAHMDISPDNIFVCKGDCFKLGDLGSARFFSPGQLFKGCFGKKSFRCREMTEQMYFSPTAADSCALGVTFFILITGTNLGEEERRDEKLKKDKLLTALSFLPQAQATDITKMIIGLMESKEEKRWNLTMVNRVLSVNY